MSKQTDKATDKLRACPCGAQPETLNISDAGRGGKYMMVSGDCCGDWHVEFRANYAAIDSPEAYALAAFAWNMASRNDCP